jgi:hypothetical protein
MSARSFPAEQISSRIFVVREQRVMLDEHLAELYGVPTKALAQAVKRNLRRFPTDFMFQITDQELTILKSQIVTSRSEAGWGGRRKPLNAFTEQGVAMLSSVLRSDRAIAANIAIMRTFIRLREIVSANADLTRKLDELERQVSGHDQAISNIVRAIRELAAPTESTPNRRIGFV